MNLRQKDACPSCGNPKWVMSRRCQPCHLKQRRADAEDRICPVCHGEKRPQQRRCSSCTYIAVPSGPPIGTWADLCDWCHERCTPSTGRHCFCSPTCQAAHAAWGFERDRAAAALQAYWDEQRFPAAAKLGAQVAA